MYVKLASQSCVYLVVWIASRVATAHPPRADRDSLTKEMPNMLDHLNVLAMTYPSLISGALGAFKSSARNFSQTVTAAPQKEDTKD